MKIISGLRAFSKPSAAYQEMMVSLGILIKTQVK